MEHPARAALNEAILRLDAKHDDSKTDGRYRPGLLIAARMLRAFLRGDDEPAVQQAERSRVYLSVEIEFVGEYYSPGEMVTVSKDWIEGAFCDRQDVRGVDIQGVVRAVE